MSGPTKLACRCVYNLAPVDADGNCGGCGCIRVEAWQKAVRIGRIGRLTKNESEEAIAPPLAVPREEGALFYDDEEAE